MDPVAAGQWDPLITDFGAELIHLETKLELLTVPGVLQVCSASVGIRLTFWSHVYVFIFNFLFYCSVDCASLLLLFS